MTGLDTKKTPQNEVQTGKYYLIYLRRRVNTAVIKETKIKTSEHAIQKQRQGKTPYRRFSILSVDGLESKQI